MLESGQVELAFIGGLGPMEVIVIFLIVLLLFGAKRIPEIAQGLGKGIKEFKKATREITDEFNANNDSTDYIKNELKGHRPADKPQQSPSQSQKSDTKQG